MAESNWLRASRDPVSPYVRDDGLLVQWSVVRGRWIVLQMDHGRQMVVFFNDSARSCRYWADKNNPLDA